jgi:K+-sensing histidine kinase KdpD
MKTMISAHWARHDGSRDAFRAYGPILARSRPHLRLSVLRGYAVGLGVVTLCTFLSVAGAPILHTAAFIMVFPLGVLVVAARFGVGPAVLTAVGGVLAFDYVFVPPAMAFAVPDAKDGLTLVVMVAVAAVATALAEQLRRRAQNARRHAEIESLRNALLSALSHDLRTPLTALVGASTALHEDCLDPHERREFSRMVAEEAMRLNRLVGNLLELTRLESGCVTTKPTPQAIEEVIGSALCRLDGQLVGRLVRTDVPEAIPLAPFDPVLIEQVIINLLENVIRHTPRGSPIEICVGTGEEQILVEVADRGPGVPDGEEERVFERLYRGTSRGDGGVGLGLTICRAIMTAHSGWIWLENRPGGGAVVRLTLPRGASATQHSLDAFPAKTRSR